ncbi:PepSY domain-containing protein [Hyphomicrobiaceae bacterium 22]|uniref:PepSY domain-containing protein n=1 Tax=Prosthecodimorpha staleyi TaxID=2840188 RepID=A0A947D6G8_9HYPH|nr:PepSY domain-containing protein [Prosthecodimorpha staleyi]
MLFLALGSGPVAADSYCRVPLADWQPREALQRKLEAEGWTVEMIRAHDGCYRVHAVNAAGERLQGRFDPATLAMVGRRGEGRGRDHRHGDDDHD